MHCIVFQMQQFTAKKKILITFLRVLHSVTTVVMFSHYHRCGI